MPLRKDDTEKALYLLESYSSQLENSQQNTLKVSVDRLIEVLKSTLFNALLDIQEYYEVSLEGELNSKAIATQLQKLAIEKKKKTSSSRLPAPTRAPPKPPTLDSFPLPPSSGPQNQQLNNSIDGGWEYEEIKLDRSENGYGFSIGGGHDVPYIEGDPAIYVTKVIPDCVAYLDGRLRLEDIILSVNSTSVEYVSHNEAVEALKHAGNSLALIIRRPRVSHSPMEDSLSPAQPQQPDDPYITLEFTKRPDKPGLGFRIAGGMGSEGGDLPITVVKVIPGGLAHEDGRMEDGDQLVKVNDVSLARVTHDEAVTALGAAGNHVILIVRKMYASMSQPTENLDSRVHDDDHNGKTKSKGGVHIGGFFKKKKK